MVKNTEYYKVSPVIDLISHYSRTIPQILGIAKDANDVELKKAYRKESLKWHPGRHCIANPLSPKTDLY